MKIAEEGEARSGGAGKALRAMGTAAVGGAAGYGTAELLARKMKFFNQAASPEVLGKRVRAARIILPILSGAAVMLADRYRQKLNEEYSQVRGYKGEK